MLNNFIYAKKKSLFEQALNNGEVLDESIVFIEDTKEIWNHGTYFDGKYVDISNIEASIQNIINNKADKSEVPTKVSELENDKGYLTEHQDISGKQDNLVSGTNIKTINGESLLGDGDLEIGGITIVPSIDELDTDAPIGSIATVTQKENIIVPISQDFEPNKEVGTLIVTPPQKIEIDSSMQSGIYGKKILTVRTSGYNIDLNVYIGYKEYSTSTYYLLLGEQGSGYLEYARYSANGDLLTVNNDRISSLISKVTTYGAYLDPLADEFFKVSKDALISYIYIKNEMGWEEIQKELKDNIVEIDNNIVEIENDLNTIKAEANLVYDSVDDLPSDAPVGTLAKVMMVIGEKTNRKPLSEVVDGEIVNKLVIDSLPESIDMTAIKTFLGTSNPHGQNAASTLTGIKLGGKSLVGFFMSGTSDSTYNGFYFGTSANNTSAFFHYKVNGTLNKFDQAQLDKFNASIQGTNAQFYWNVSANDNPGLKETLGGFVYAETTEILISPTQYFKDTDGWKQIAGEVANDLEGGANKVLSAEMGKVLKEDIDSLRDSIPTKTSELTNDSGYITAEYVEQEEDITEYFLVTGDIAQELGNDETKVISQKAVTDAINNAITNTLNTKI